MSRTIRIGTRDSQLALWQAKAVQGQLEYLGHSTGLVKVKSTGDLVLDKPLYELGITGIFTKTLDVALLNNEIDIAVHSLKDVPTALPKGIVQAAVLKRGNVKDILVYKDNEEFLSQEKAVIATGSLRRKAQWLNRYPTHKVTDLRGNVNLRLQKLQDNEDWNGAIFAAAGLGRIGLSQKNSIPLDWMVPAPGQGAIMIAARKEDDDILEACKAINHEETEICTTVERLFLRYLEGGCTAPIGALCQIKDEQVHLQGILLNFDGTKKIEVKRFDPLGKHGGLAKYCADSILERGGKRLMGTPGSVSEQPPHIYSTKSLTPEQELLFRDGIRVKSTDAIKIYFNRIPKASLKRPLKNVLITSKNAAEAILFNLNKEELNFGNIYCVGRKTKRFVEKNIGNVTHYENNAADLAAYFDQHFSGTELTYFCSNIRLDELPDKLAKQGVVLEEIIAYETKLDADKIEHDLKGVMFFSPSGVSSYMQINKPKGTAYCIGPTTAEEAANYFEDVKISSFPSAESLIELINSDL
ncbi:hydroxymethylbilane synthase [Aegicerativicinus sediminis]|uniref:hydroxymethylbilane synthase n=1 Tax=Aegicerativicinus sediminis TaxID=2893202 RepID=UPI001E46E171|nr:hydroxymethylbilane synthase [Aegicerativicinus sediminis]